MLGFDLLAFRNHQLIRTLRARRSPSQPFFSISSFEFVGSLQNAELDRSAQERDCRGRPLQLAKRSNKVVQGCGLERDAKRGVFWFGVRRFELRRTDDVASGVDAGQH
jgi:hypothetical protein